MLKKKDSARKRLPGENEHKLQKSCIDWFNLQYPKYKALLWATPNANILIGKIPNRERPIVWKYMEDEGLKSGVPDLMLAMARGTFHGFFIEMKMFDGKTSPEQESYIRKLTIQGYKVKVIKSLEQFIFEINSYIALPEF